MDPCRTASSRQSSIASAWTAGSFDLHSRLSAVKPGHNAMGVRFRLAGKNRQKPLLSRLPLGCPASNAHAAWRALRSAQAPHPRSRPR